MSAWGFGPVRIRAFTRLAFWLVKEAWRRTREVEIGQHIEMTVELDVE